ncbi:MAG: hypothetical protein IJX47_04685 [Clostridia bacterium]|nr:hypothetical protein [Clostridia bacterium]
MPAVYAHRVFGDAVINTLSHALFERLEPHLPLFRMGLHGPDLLFYYQPLRKTPLREMGDLLHQRTGRQVLGCMLDTLSALPSERQDAGFAYVLGFVCHYLLDSACHPYVEQLTKAGKAPHCTIEGEFDLWLIAAEEKKPWEVDPVSHLAELSAEDCAVIASFFAALSRTVYPEAPLKERAGQIVSAHRTMLRLNRIFASPNGAVRGIARAGLFLVGSYDEQQGLVYKDAFDPAFDGCCTHLFSLMEGALWETPSVLESLTRGELAERLDRPFG